MRNSQSAIGNAMTGKKQILLHTVIYGVCGGVLIVVLRLIEFRFLVIERAVEIYGGLIALLFSGLGIWLGLKLTRKPELIVKEVAVPAPSAFVLNEERRRELYLEGHRLGDVRRYNLPLSPAAGTPYAFGGVYGTQSCFPLPDVEKINNPNITK